MSRTERRLRFHAAAGTHIHNGRKFLRVKSTAPVGLDARKPDPEVIKLVSCSIQLFLTFKRLDIVFIHLISAKMPTIVGILTVISRINFMLIWVEHDKKFYILWACLRVSDHVRLEPLC